MIEFKDVYKIYNEGQGVSEVRALDGVSFVIDEGEFVAIIGASGSGKSTCMNIIGCLDLPTRGEYILDGMAIGEYGEDELAKIRNKTMGFIFQQYNLIPKMSVYENVELPLIYGVLPLSERKERVMWALERVGLDGRAHSMPNQLSGGQQQRVSVARALAGKPSVLLADEPTGALDSKTGRELMDLLHSLHQEGHTIVLITHDNGLAAEAARLIRLADGKIIEDSRQDGGGEHEV